MIHRDIKLENILVTNKEELHIKLGDFGLSRIIGEEQFSRAVCGTPSYLAPEILSDDPSKRYSRGVDIWSCGVTLYICLCGFPPFSDELFSAEFPYSLDDQIVKGYFTYPSPYWDTVGDSALDMIDGMLAVDPRERFSIDSCFRHAWIITGVLEGLYDRSVLEHGEISDSKHTTDMLTYSATGSASTLNVRDRSSRRSKLARERTLIASSHKK
jgi:serine/threonine protein kinase